MEAINVACAPEALWHLQHQHVVMWAHAMCMERVDVGGWSAPTFSVSSPLLTSSSSPNQNQNFAMPPGLHQECSDGGTREPNQDLQAGAADDKSVSFGSPVSSEEDRKFCDNITSAVRHFLSGDVVDSDDDDTDNDSDAGGRTLKKPVRSRQDADDSTSLLDSDVSDNFSDDVWRSLELFLRTITALPGTIHDAALALRAQDIPHLRDLTIGELEVVVRSAVGQRHVLKFYRGSLRPARVARQLETWDNKARQTKDTRRPTPVATVIEAPAPITQDAPTNLCLAPRIPAPTPVRIADLVGHPTHTVSMSEDPVACLARLMKQFPNGVPVTSARKHLQQCEQTPVPSSRIAELFPEASTA